MKRLSELLRVLRSLFQAAWGQDLPPNERMTNPPVPVNVEVIPFTMTIKGKMTVPAGTPREAVQAAVLSGVTLTCVLASSGIESINVDTSGLTLAK